MEKWYGMRTQDVVEAIGTLLNGTEQSHYHD